MAENKEGFFDRLRDILAGLFGDNGKIHKDNVYKDGKMEIDKDRFDDDAKRERKN